MGPATRGAIRGYQAANDRIADGYPSQDILNELTVAPEAENQPDASEESDD